MADQSSFKEGDVVMLKSGGPRMVIVKIADPVAECVWFDGGPKTVELKIISLVKVDAATNPTELRQCQPS